MFSEDESEVVLLDYQLMGLFHPARDLWYFLSLATDADFRRAHLQDLLKDYFQVFNTYLKDADIDMTFDQVWYYERRIQRAESTFTIATNEVK